MKEKSAISDTFGSSKKARKAFRAVTPTTEEKRPSNAVSNFQHNRTKQHKMSSSFQLGQLVRLKGLNNAAYNGKLAQIGPFPSAELCCNGRYRVELIDEVAPPLRQSVDVKPENMEHACKRCHKGGEKLLFCGKCKHVRYCDRECQRIDWERHKKECGSCGFDRDATKNPLMLAALCGDLRLVQKLVEEDCIDVNMTSNITNSTALLSEHS